MKQIIFATNNPTKAKRFSKSLLEKEINVISLRDIGIKINIKEKTLDFVVSDEELARRKATWTPREPKVTTGYLARYASMVTSGDKGAVLKANK